MLAGDGNFGDFFFFSVHFKSVPRQIPVFEHRICSLFIPDRSTEGPKRASKAQLSWIVDDPACHHVTTLRAEVSSWDSSVV